MDEARTLKLELKIEWLEVAQDGCPFYIQVRDFS